MKRSEIELGKTYHNGAKAQYYQERQIIGCGEEYKLYPSQLSTDCLRYRVVKGRAETSEGNITRAAMAAWARGIVGGMDNDKGS